MGIPSSDSASELALPAVTAGVSRARPSEIECEVMNLFEQYRNPILRYVVAFGVGVHDAEEVTQEVFLSLFRHLRLGRSRKNLRGWMFRVAHNLALKQCQANQKVRNTTAADETIAERQSDPSPDPEEQLSAAQRRQRLLAVVNAL